MSANRKPLRLCHLSQITSASKKLLKWLQKCRSILCKKAYNQMKPPRYKMKTLLFNEKLSRTNN